MNTSRTTPRRAALALTATASLAAAGSVALAAPAVAASPATASVGTTAVYYQAGTGQFNHVKIDTVYVVAGKFLIKRVRIDDWYAITPGAGCSPVVADPTQVTCTLKDLLVVHADDGNDVVTVATGIQSLVYGEAGNDTLTSGPTTSATAINYLFGGDGNDTLAGGTGRDLLVGGLGQDGLTGGAGEDIVSYLEKTVPVYADPDGASGDDGTLFEHDSIGADVEDLWGGSSNDYLYGNDGPNVLRGYGGNDVITGKLGADVVDGGTGIDTASYADHNTAVVADLDAAAGDDGAAGEHDTISAVESLTGGSGNDLLVGDAGYNVLSGGSGNDGLYGLGSGDVVNGGSGDDYLSGGDGNDSLDGGYGKDYIGGGTGSDTVSYASRASGVTVRLDHTGVYDDGNALDGLPGARDNVDPGVENVDGGFGSDVIVGTPSSNVLRGGTGTDYLYGGGGDDFLYGNPSYDYLYGQTGSDLCDVGNGKLADPVEGVSFDCEYAYIVP